MGAIYENTLMTGDEPYISTHTGKLITFFNPKPDQICIKDIAQHLSITCRFNGLMHKFYSNAEHSILGCFQTDSIKVKRAFLLHDAAEFVFADLPAPVKKFIPQYKEMIDKFQDYLYKHFNTDPCVNEVSEIDKRICISEMYYLRGQKTKDFENYIYNIEFNCWNQKEAYYRFLDYFAFLFPEVKIG